MNKNILNFLKSLLLWFCVFYLAMWAYQKYVAPPADEANTANTLSVEMVDKTPVVGQLLQFKVNNTTAKDWTWRYACKADTLQLLARVAGQEVAVEPACESAVTQTETIPAGSQALITLPHFNTELFSEPGTYQAQFAFTAEDETKTLKTGEFEIRAPGVIRRVFRSLITQPLFNALVWLIEVLPNHSLGWAIVILTLLVRVLLFLPNQKAMASQRKLQKIQPQIQALRKKHGKNQQALALETMALYKQHKINPASSCLPMLLQMPFLIGIYLVVKDGLSPHLNHLLYPFHAGVDLSMVKTSFFGLDLSIPNVLVLPILVAAAQWLAIRLSMSAAKKQQPKTSESKKKKTNKKDEAPDMMQQMEQMQTMMQWMLPAMIGFFTMTFPAAVGIYWLTSTVFGIGQQKLVNWQLDQPKVKRKAKTTIEA